MTQTALSSIWYKSIRLFIKFTYWQTQITTSSVPHPKLAIPKLQFIYPVTETCNPVRSPQISATVPALFQSYTHKMFDFGLIL